MSAKKAVKGTVMVPFPVDKLRKIAEYVGRIQPILEKVSAWERKLAGDIPGVVDALVANDLLSAHLKSAKVKELTADPSSVFGVLRKTASLVSKPMGRGIPAEADASMEKSADQLFEDRIMS